MGYGETVKKVLAEYGTHKASAANHRSQVRLWNAYFWKKEPKVL